MEAGERHHQAEEWHLEAMRVAKQREDKFCRQIAAMKATVERIERPARETMSIQAFWGPPFSEEIDRTPIPAIFWELVVEPFDSTQDPHPHLQAFQTQMYISGGNDSLNCKLFLDTLKGMTMHWLATLLTHTIRSSNDLVVFFDIRQTKGESLKSYLVRFNNATVRVNNLNQKFFVKAFQKGIGEIRARAKKHIKAKEDLVDRLEAELQPMALQEMKPDTSRGSKEEMRY
ncbi:hypothetical protein CR513_41976, partial [Mucuna pruriens]